MKDFKKNIARRTIRKNTACQCNTWSVGSTSSLNAKKMLMHPVRTIIKAPGKKPSPHTIAVTTMPAIIAMKPMIISIRKTAFLKRRNFFCFNFRRSSSVPFIRNSCYNEYVVVMEK